MRKILIVGATSVIAEAVARRFAADGDAFFLVGRNATRLEAIGADLRIRGAPAVYTATLDVSDIGSQAAMLAKVEGAMGVPDIVLIAHGTLPDQRACEQSVTATVSALNVNFTATLALLTLIANRFETAGRGTIAVITSVAGDRGRRSNYLYGAAKGGVSIFLSGLRHRLQARGVAVLDIRPGFVDTPMTSAFAKGTLWAKPDRVALDICHAIKRGAPVLYTPWFWRWIMQIVRILPLAVFHRTRL